MFTYSHLHTHFSPSLISLMVSVDVKHHVYLHLHTPFSPSLISRAVSVDVEHHVYSLTTRMTRGTEIPGGGGRGGSVCVCVCGGGGDATPSTPQ